MASLAPLSGVLGHRRAAHLLRRTSFRYTKPKVDELAGKTAAEALASLLQLYPQQLDQPVYDDPTTTDVVENIKWINPYVDPTTFGAEDFMVRRWLLGWWVNEALQDPGIGHKMTFFFHQYFVTVANTLGTQHYYDYLALLRWGALGNFKKLATKMVTDNTMLRYLNNQENVAGNPNENFAREFFELFTIGKGPQAGDGDYTNYTEADIVQAARVFTGFRTRFNRNVIDAETGIPRGDASFFGTGGVQLHDSGTKQFSARFQNTVIPGATNSAGMFTELNAFVDMIFAQEETAKFTCRRLYRYFVSRQITDEIENDIIAPLASTFRNNNYEIKPVLEQLLKSEHFYDTDDSDNADEIVGGLIKSPLELSLQAMTFFGVPIPDPLTQNTQHYVVLYSRGVIDRMFALSGMMLFFPSDVAGYPAYYQSPDFNRQWFNSSTIIARYKLPQMLLTGRYQIGGNPNGNLGTKLNIAPWLKNSGVVSDPEDPYVVVQDLLSYLLPEQVDAERFNYFLNDVFLDNLPPADWTYEWQNYLASNNATEVTIPLERLINAIMYSPEYQTF
ncbi:MAG: DUF1800 family protein [Saprospiraceae bacterium]|nr:DUF1800 family protein [Saprospiraceae bacterium]